jgi:hypothetical protein
VVLSVVAFVRVHLRVGRPWLAWTIAALRTLVLVLNFAAKTNFNFREITGVRHIQMLGESVSEAFSTSQALMIHQQARGIPTRVTPMLGRARFSGGGVNMA